MSDQIIPIFRTATGIEVREPCLGDAVQALTRLLLPRLQEGSLTHKQYEVELASLKLDRSSLVPATLRERDEEIARLRAEVSRLKGEPIPSDEDAGGEDPALYPSSPIEDLGLPAKQLETLRKLGCATIADVAELSPTELSEAGRGDRIGAVKASEIIGRAQDIVGQPDPDIDEDDGADLEEGED